ncbi:hypothetical protein F5X96DRAFT_624570 [Biscogniauxia mediterranea]|nr:hypothetical protein F5X96DRAFT_624570 [Biscogniauxia mediterranea]
MVGLCLLGSIWSLTATNVTGSPVRAVLDLLGTSIPSSIATHRASPIRNLFIRRQTVLSSRVLLFLSCLNAKNRAVTKSASNANVEKGLLGTRA